MVVALYSAILWQQKEIGGTWNLWSMHPYIIPVNIVIYSRGHMHPGFVVELYCL